MKKFFYVLMAAATLAAVSCEKTPNGENNEENGGTTETRKQLVHLTSYITEEGELTGGRKFYYTEDGKISKVAEVWTNEDGSEGSYDLNVTWEGNKATFDDGEGTGFIFTIGDNGYAVQKDELKDGEVSSTYTYEYDAEGHLTKVNELYEGQTYAKSVCTWENGNLTSWSDVGAAEDGSGNDRVKRQTYTQLLNTCGIHTSYTEKSSLKRWMFEIGLFGKASVNLVAMDKWDDREGGKTFEYRFDEDDYVITETPYWEGEAEKPMYFGWK